MFSYRHIYHAGNFADVFKHILLVGLLKSLQKKEAGLVFHDTHAGIGVYDLNSEQASLNREYEQGYLRLQNKNNAPEWVQDYLSLIHKVNHQQPITLYPGSPMLARQLLRPQDYMLLTELNKVDHATLKKVFAQDKQVAVHLQDAWQGMKAFIPPKLKRGLVLIDPPYELKHEVSDLLEALKSSFKKWPAGVYAVWYPIFNDKFADELRKKLVKTGIRKILDARLIVRKPGEGRRMIGSGMVIINPPWQFDEHLQGLMPWLHSALEQSGQGNYAVDWLVPE